MLSMWGTDTIYIAAAKRERERESESERESCPSKNKPVGLHWTKRLRHS